MSGRWRDRAVKLIAKPGFDPMLINWGAPDQARTTRCSYWDAPFDDDGDERRSLIMWNPDGWATEFCDACQRRWFGLRT